MTINQSAASYAESYAAALAYGETQTLEEYIRAHAEEPQGIGYAPLGGIVQADYLPYPVEAVATRARKYLRLMGLEAA